jgi:small subunit ribosomal protein S13
MARIAGVNLPTNKRIEVALTYILGIGPNLSKQILTKAKVSSDTRVKDLTAEEENCLRQIVEKEYKVEGSLRRDVMANIKRMKEVKCYRGLRHIKGLSVRGQRTKTNSRTVRGNTRRTMGSGRRVSAQKT